MLPAIRELSVSGSLSAGPVRETIERFVTARGVPAFRDFEWPSAIGITVPWPDRPLKDGGVLSALTDEIPVTVLQLLSLSPYVISLIQTMASVVGQLQYFNNSTKSAP